MHKFFVDESFIDGNIVNIQGDDVKHIYRVLRLKSGDQVNINNCKGEEFLAQIKDINKTNVLCEIIEKADINNESALKIYLYQGLPKAAKMDFIIQKSTELGVTSITPVITERVVVKNELKEYKKVDRWNKIALEACKQSKRTIIPKVNQPMELEGFLSEADSYDLIVVPYESKEDFGIKAMIRNLNGKKINSIAILIGPEGGFEEEEIEKLDNLGAQIVTLGPRILRTETAGLVCASLLLYELGDIGGKI
ncbi:16S rRNA (uracil(1498)-N(3))-methyltransferase [Clostridium akagii]|uniref:16S rRNA (uracil(1498)-N(3))-methyltransferase n=1 Tax=Clostridium akagii TaxID=91623 RepID=UPI00047E09B6|nr:16S rRNA (uracil(1498)-N(3))-methyltransferase [Clostridium akagii]